MLIIETAETQETPRVPRRQVTATNKIKRSIARSAEDQNPRSFADPNSTFNFENILDYGAQPLFTTPEIFEDLATRIYAYRKGALQKFCQTFSKKPLKVLTFCSGTESPILAMQLVQKSKFPSILN